MRGLNFAMIGNQKLAANESKPGPKKMKKENDQKTASKKNSDAPKLTVRAFFIFTAVRSLYFLLMVKAGQRARSDFNFIEWFRITFKLNFPGQKSVGKAGGEKCKSMSETEKSPYLEKASKRKAYQTVLQENKKKKQGPVVRTSGASSSSDGVIAERSEPMPTVVSLSFAEGKLKNADELVKSTVGKLSENQPPLVRSLWLVNLVVLLLVSLSVEPVHSFSASCFNELIGFTPCLGYAYAAPYCHDNSPTLDCCNAFIAAVQSGEDLCLCILIKEPKTLGIAVNQTRILLLSSICQSTIPTDLKTRCGGRGKLPPTFFFPDSGIEEHASMEANKGSFLPAFFILLGIGIVRVLLVIIF